MILVNTLNVQDCFKVNASLINRLKLHKIEEVDRIRIVSGRWDENANFNHSLMNKDSLIEIVDRGKKLGLSKFIHDESSPKLGYPIVFMFVIEFLC